MHKLLRISPQNGMLLTRRRLMQFGENALLTEALLSLRSFPPSSISSEVSVPQYHHNTCGGSLPYVEPSQGRMPGRPLAAEYFVQDPG